MFKNCFYGARGYAFFLFPFFNVRSSSRAGDDLHIKRKSAEDQLQV